MKNWEDLTAVLIKFREERNWKQFHNAKDLALALYIEAAELNEVFLWKNPESLQLNPGSSSVQQILSIFYGQPPAVSIRSICSGQEAIMF